MTALRRIADRNDGVVTNEEREAGFVYQGERVPFANTQRGIWRPKILKGGVGAALSITTSAVRPGRAPKYDDEIGSEGWFSYRYQGVDPAAWDNRALRAAFEYNRPVIYFYGVAPGLYYPMMPSYIIADDPGSLTFSVAIDSATTGIQTMVASGSPEALKAYATGIAKVRLHQRRFREMVVGAYQRKCAVCSLGTTDRLTRLLDAAHILPDHDERGRPEVSNGLSLCKIHHSAYDLNILGIDPDFRVHIRQDILAEIDGPMLQHGLKEMDSGLLRVLPVAKQLRPNLDSLSERYNQFRAA